MRSQWMSTRERGRPARTILARPRPSPPPGSTGNGARTLLRPRPCRSRRQGGRARHPRGTERYATAQHAGGTPALPGGRLLPSLLLFKGGRRRLGGPHPSRCGSVVTPGGPSWITLVSFDSGESCQVPFQLGGPSCTPSLDDGWQPKKSPGSERAGAGETATFDQNSNARLKRADRIPARNPGSRVAVGELMLKVGWLGEYPQLA